jgi:hypothetical protein
LVCRSGVRTGMGAGGLQVGADAYTCCPRPCFYTHPGCADRHTNCHAAPNAHGYTYREAVTNGDGRQADVHGNADPADTYTHSSDGNAH